MRLLERHYGRLQSGSDRLPPDECGQVAVGVDITAAATELCWPRLRPRHGNSQKYGDFREHCGSPAAARPLVALGTFGAQVQLLPLFFALPALNSGAAGWQPAASSPTDASPAAAWRCAEVVIRNPRVLAVSHN